MLAYYSAFATVVATASAIQMEPDWYKSVAGIHFNSEDPFFAKLAYN